MSERPSPRASYTSAYKLRVVPQPIPTCKKITKKCQSGVSTNVTCDVKNV